MSTLPTALIIGASRGLGLALANISSEAGKSSPPCAAIVIPLSMIGQGPRTVDWRLPRSTSMWKTRWPPCAVSCRHGG